MNKTNKTQSVAISLVSPERLCGRHNLSGDEVTNECICTATPLCVE